MMGSAGGKDKMAKGEEQDEGGKPLPEAARRALDEAAERRRQRDAQARSNPVPREFNGRDGPEPVRYGDWEKDGIAVDF